MKTYPLALLLLVAAVPPGLAEHCESYSTSEPEVTTPSDPTTLGVVPTYYHDQDICWSSGTCVSSYWIYEESNGLPGLQREDEIVDDTCHGMIPGDTIVF